MGRTSLGRGIAGGLIALLGIASCRRDAGEPDAATRDRRRAAACPADRPVEAIAGVAAHHRVARFWLDRLPAGEADRVILGPEELRAANARIRTLPEGRRDLADPTIVDPEAVRREHEKRFIDVRAWIAARRVVPTDPRALDDAERIALEARPVDRTHVAPAELEVWCMPMRASLLAPVGGSVEFDRNRCSEIHPGELVRVRAASADGRWLNVRTAYLEGWLDRPDLGPVLGPAELRAWMEPARPAIVRAARLERADLPALRMGTVVPTVSAGDGRATVPWPAVPRARPVSVPIGADLALGFPPLTRRNVFELALARLGTRYGWGGWQGGLDCSRFLLDLLGVFGLGLPRNSGIQALAGDPSLDVHGWSVARKLQALRESARCGIVLLQMPGHIVLYLGEADEPGDGSGSWVVSSIAEMREPCPAGGETVLRLNRVEVSTLAVGRGTSKRSFLERIDRIAVFGRCPGAGNQ